LIVLSVANCRERSFFVADGAEGIYECIKFDCRLFSGSLKMF
jgi:hypothetical protein